MENLKEKPVKSTRVVVGKKSLKERFVFMDKTINILEVGFQTNHNVILFGPGE